jgi:hypothetical protein
LEGNFMNKIKILGIFDPLKEFVERASGRD